MAIEKVLTPEVLAMIGKESSTASGPDEVCKSETRRWVQATMDDNPLWYDEEFAKKTKFGTGCVPVPYALRAVGFYRKPMGSPDLPRSKGADDDVRGDLETENEIRIPWPAGMAEFHAGDEVEYFQMPRAGDIISVKSRIMNIIEKTGRSGKLGISFVDRTYTNQKGEILAINHHTSIAREMQGKAWHK
jgi:hypothetical protein